MSARTAQLRRLPWRLRYEVGGRWASTARRLAIQATHLHCHVEFQGPVHLGPGFNLFIPGSGSFVVGPGVEFRRRFTCEVHGDGKVTIGANTVFTYDTVIQCSTSIDIGADCAIGQAIIVDGNHKYQDHSRPFMEQGYDFRPVRIADGAVIMSKTTITHDIGQRAVIGANTVVNRPIPAYSLAVGAPARVIKYFGPPELRPEPLADDG